MHVPNNNASLAFRFRRGQGPQEGGPGITQSDMLVINKTDLAAAVGADLKVPGLLCECWSIAYIHQFKTTSK